MTLWVIGGGLAGCEAAWQAVLRGLRVKLLEMRPVSFTPAHKTPYFAELVCSNSFKALAIDTASGLLKEEMALLGSLTIKVAKECQVPAGGALAVDRDAFAQRVSSILESHPFIEVVREEVLEVPAHRPLVIATGPLTSPAFSKSLTSMLGEEHLYFYDAISPIVMGDSVDYEKAFWGSRYGKGGGEDYLNCPLTEEEYERFYEALLDAERVPLRTFEDAKFFQGCMPIEELAAQGKETPLFGPMKPVGLVDPRTGRQPFAVVQLRRENKQGTMWNMVGFQTRLKWPEQASVFRLVPALKRAEFARYGSIHRNTFINSPKLLGGYLNRKGDEGLFFAGQITGVEGYIESAAMGVLAGINAACWLRGDPLLLPPETTMVGSLVRYVALADSDVFQPMNSNFGLLPPISPVPRRKRDRKMAYSQRALEHLRLWISENGLNSLSGEVVDRSFEGDVGYEKSRIA